MTASEMFKQLGYHVIDRPYHNSPIGYFRRLDYNTYVEILFLLSEKKVAYSSTNGVNDCVVIQMPELKAIYKQCVELGWLND